MPFTDGFAPGLNLQRKHVAAEGVLKHLGPSTISHGRSLAEAARCFECPVGSGRVRWISTSLVSAVLGHATTLVFALVEKHGSYVWLRARQRHASLRSATSEPVEQ
jgi:hypothetical protein